MVNGRRKPEGKPIPYYFPGIIAEQDFYSAQDYRSKRRTAGGGRRGDYISNLFSKIAQCHYCRGPMRYENKGSGANRVAFLVCDNAVRGKGCRAIRWAYREIEASILALVEELDLGSFLTSSKTAQERAELDQQIKSLHAQLERMETERQNAYALLESQGADLPYVRDRLERCEIGLTTLKRELASLEEHQRSAQQARRSYDLSKAELRSLVSQIGSGGSDDVYRTRAQIASRLRTILVSLTLAPAGGAPVASWDTALVVPTGVPAHADVGIGLNPREGRYFIACFGDGTFRAVYPADHDPFAFHQQVVFDRLGSESREIEGDAGRTNYIDLTPFKPANIVDPNWPPRRSIR